MACKGGCAPLDAGCGSCKAACSIFKCNCDGACNARGNCESKCYDTIVKPCISSCTNNMDAICKGAVTLALTQGAKMASEGDCVEFCATVGVDVATAGAGDPVSDAVAGIVSSGCVEACQEAYGTLAEEINDRTAFSATLCTAMGL